MNELEWARMREHKNNMLEICCYAGKDVRHYNPDKMPPTGYVCRNCSGEYPNLPCYEPNLTLVRTDESKKKWDAEIQTLQDHLTTR